MNLLKKTLILIIAILFVLWGQLAAFQNNCHCSSDQKQQEESVSGHSCCANPQEMSNCRMNSSQEIIQKPGCNNKASDNGLSLAQLNKSHELCQSQCEIHDFGNEYFTSLTNTFDTSLFLNSTLLTLLPANFEYASEQYEHIFRYAPIPIFLLNVSFLN